MPGRTSSTYAGRELEVLRLGDQAVEGKISWLDAARVYGAGVSPDAFRVKYNRLKESQKLGLPLGDKTPKVDPLLAAQHRRESMRELEKERTLLDAVAGEKSLRSFLERLIRSTAQQFPKVEAPKLPPLRKTGTVTEETLVLSLSDWHAYELVDIERTRGFNSYDATTFGRRVRAIIDRAISIKSKLEAGGGWRFPRLVLGLNGDFVSGTIHEVERHSDAPSIVHAVYGAGLVLAQAIRDLAAVFPQIDVYCSSGNHGRFPDARRMQQKDPMRSWDTMLYLYALEHLRATKHIRWHIPNSYSVAFDVEGWRFLQTHGHDVKSWNQIPHYGINRMVSNLNALEASRRKLINYFLFGHFHTKTSLEHASGEWFINGSLIGGTEFSVQGMGRSDKPTQWFLGVHKEHGVTHRWPLLAEAGPKAPGYEVEPWRKLAA